MSSRWRAANVAAGNFFFRWRNNVFPVVFALTLVFARPRVLFGSAGLDALVQWLGVGVALCGEAVRLLTIGFEYIDRGGRAGRVWASKLVEGGIYALVRNPMYVGNGLIAAGATMAAGAPLVYGLALPFFVFVYQAIIAAEEDWLGREFGDAYAAYCRRVPRIVPALGRVGTALRESRFHVRRALRKDMSTMLGLGLGLMALTLWRRHALLGAAAAKQWLPAVIVLGAAMLVLWSVLFVLKKRTHLLDDAP